MQSSLLYLESRSETFLCVNLQAWEVYKGNSLLQIVDPALHMDFPEEEALRFLMVGLLCVQETVKLRPSMSTTVKMLTNENDIRDVQISQPGLLSDLMDIRLRQKHSSQRTQTTFSRGSTSTSTHSTSYFWFCNFCSLTPQKKDKKIFISNQRSLDNNSSAYIVWIMLILCGPTKGFCDSTVKIPFTSCWIYWKNNAIE